MYYDGIISKPPLDEIYHHGIKGQKWGVRNGPPYPLDSSKSTDYRSNDIKLNKVLKGNAAYRYMNFLDHHRWLAYLDPTGAIALSHFVARSKALSGIQNLQYLKSKVRYKKLKELRKHTKVNEETGFKEKKNPNATKEEDMEMVNALRGKKNKTKGSYNNCAYCTTAYDLRRRNLEVHAPSKSNGVKDEDIESWYKDGKLKEFKKVKNPQTANTAKIITDQLKKEPVGSRGNLLLTWKFGGGHSVAYEIENGHKVVVYDTQANRKLESKELEDYLNRAVLQTPRGFNSKYMRTDNLEPNYKLLKKKGIVVS